MRLEFVNIKNILRAFTWNYRDKQIAGGIKKLSRGIFKNVQTEVPVKSGRLKRSLGDKKVSNLEYHHVESVWWGKLIRSGSPPHPIYPKRPKYALWWKELSHPIPYVKRHPGFKKIPYNITAVNNSQGLIDQVATEIGENISIKLIDI